MFVYKPAPSSARQTAIARSLEPISIETIGDSVLLIENPSAVRPERTRRTFAHSRGRSSWSSLRICSAAATDAIVAGETDAVKTYGRVLKWRSFNASWFETQKPP